MALAPSFRPSELSFSLPRHPHTILHVHLSCLGGCAVVHLTTSTLGESVNSNAPIGSFVYAMPDRLIGHGTLSTPLNPSGSSIDYATRLSKILATKLKSPVYVGCSINFAGTTAEEELEGLVKVVNEIVTLFERIKNNI